MFKLSEKFKINRTILKCDYRRHAPGEIFMINTPYFESYINIPKEDSVNTVLGSFLESNFDVLNAATGNRYAEGDGIRLVNFVQMLYLVIKS